MRKTDGRGSGAAYDSLDVGIAVIASDGSIVSWNAWLSSTSGVPPERAIGTQLENLFPNGLGNRLLPAIDQSFAFGASAVLSHTLHPTLFPLRTRAGKRLVHDVTIKPLGQMPYRQCVIQIFDVTTAAEREHVLRERQNARYAAVVDNAPDAILTIDSDGFIQSANAAVTREFGYQRDEMLGRPASVLFQNPPDWQRIWSDLLRGGAKQSVGIVGQRKNGSLSHLEVAASLWRDQTSGFVTAILRDVNDRKAAEEALHRLNETLEERVASTLAERQVLADIVEGTDAFVQVANMDYRWIAVNRASADEFERIFGVRPRVGDSMLEVLSDKPQHQSAVREVWSRALAGESFTLVDTYGERERRSYEMRFNVLRNKSGKQIGAYQFVYDVTDRLRDQSRLREAEEALRQSQKMEAVGQLTGGIAHDFNNLLAGIIGAMELLRRRINAGRFEDVQRFMDAAVSSANRAAALTHRLLAFARRQPLDPRPLDTNQLVLGMEELLRRTMGEQVRVRTDLQAGPWHVNTDANQLENALLNLAINARDAMPDGGELTISSRNVSLSDSDEVGDVAKGDYMLLSVSDTGSGMSADLVAKVFDPFFTTKPIGQGTGLGLSMVYGFAQQSGGRALIESTEDVGTVIKLYLPRYTGGLEQPVISAEVRPLASGEGETVLLVEDDSAVRLLIGEVLRDLGYRCLEATDAFAAIPILSSNVRLDLLITDVGLPKMNGRQLADIARQHRPDLKVMFVTGYAEHATGVEKFLEPGMVLVTKPFTLDSLALKIRDLIAPRA